MTDKEHIDEISKKVLGSYVKGATSDIGMKMYSAAQDGTTGGPTVRIPKTRKGFTLAAKAGKRKQFVDKAVDRLTKEQLEMAEHDDEIIDPNLDESAQDSLKPQSQAENDPKSKVETLKNMVGAANCLTNTELTKWYTSMIELYPAVAKAHGSSDANKATNNMAAGGKPLAPMPQIKIKEDMDALFEGESLTEEAQERISTLFEAAVSVRVGIVEAELQEAYEVALEEEVEEFISETEMNIESFLDYAVDRWVSENEVAIVDSLRLENAEDFMDKLKGLMIESYIDVPEERLDVVAEMTEHVVDVESQLSDALAEVLTLKTQLADKTKESIVEDLKEGLTLVDSGKLDSLIESVEFDDDPDAYSKKVRIIKEKHFPSTSKPKNEGVETLNEENLGAEDQVVYSDPLVEAAVRAMDRGAGSL